MCSREIGEISAQGAVALKYLMCSMPADEISKLDSVALKYLMCSRELEWM
jgi:hypothetical protein